MIFLQLSSILYFVLSIIMAHYVLSLFLHYFLSFFFFKALFFFWVNLCFFFFFFFFWEFSILFIFFAELFIFFNGLKWVLYYFFDKLNLGLLFLQITKYFYILSIFSRCNWRSFLIFIYLGCPIILPLELDTGLGHLQAHWFAVLLVHFLVFSLWFLQFFISARWKTKWLPFGAKWCYGPFWH